MLIEIFNQIVAVILFYSSPRLCRSPDMREKAGTALRMIRIHGGGELFY
jgi:hypothetical protein